MTAQVYVVVGGQYGSEGKGAVAARIAADSERRGRGVVCVRVGGPNAGHTVIGRCPSTCEAHVDNENGRDSDHGTHAHPWRLRQVPVAAVSNPHAQLLIAAGSEVDPQVLLDEVQTLDDAGYKVSARLHIDRSATVLQPYHIELENEREISKRLGSTAKGIGAARAERIWRTADTWERWVYETGAPGHNHLAGLHHLDGVRMLRNIIGSAGDNDIVVEGTQGYGLGLHTRNYPYVTTNDCRAIDFLSQAGVSPWQADSAGWQLSTKVVVAVRPHPIRVAGNSGHLTGETTWRELGLPEERTTVTQKIRRVGAWDPAAVREAVRANGGPREGVVWLALTMMDSVSPALAGVDATWRNWASDEQHSELAFDTVQPYLADLGVGVQHLGYAGTGPGTAIINSRMYD